MTGAGQHADPARSAVHAVMRQDLDWRDAFAWENLAQEIVGWRFGICLVWLGLGGGLPAILAKARFAAKFRDAGRAARLPCGWTLPPVQPIFGLDIDEDHA